MLLLVWFLLFCFVEIASHYEITYGLELTMQTRLDLNSQTSAYLSAVIKGLYHNVWPILTFKQHSKGL